MGSSTYGFFNTPETNPVEDPVPESPKSNFNTRRNSDNGISPPRSTFNSRNSTMQPSGYERGPRINPPVYANDRNGIGYNDPYDNPGVAAYYNSSRSPVRDDYCPRGYYGNRRDDYYDRPQRGGDELPQLYNLRNTEVDANIFNFIVELFRISTDWYSRREIDDIEYGAYYRLYLDYSEPGAGDYDHYVAAKTYNELRYNILPRYEVLRGFETRLIDPEILHKVAIEELNNSHDDYEQHLRESEYHSRNNYDRGYYDRRDDYYDRPPRYNNRAANINFRYYNEPQPRTNYAPQPEREPHAMHVTEENCYSTRIPPVPKYNVPEEKAQMTVREQPVEHKKPTPVNPAPKQNRNLLEGMTEEGLKIVRDINRELDARVHDEQWYIDNGVGDGYEISDDYANDDMDSPATKELKQAFRDRAKNNNSYYNKNVYYEPFTNKLESISSIVTKKRMFLNTIAANDKNLEDDVGTEEEFTKAQEKVNEFNKSFSLMFHKSYYASTLDESVEDLNCHVMNIQRPISSLRALRNTIEQMYIKDVLHDDKGCARCDIINYAEPIVLPHVDLKTSKEIFKSCIKICKEYTDTQDITSSTDGIAALNTCDRVTRIIKEINKPDDEKYKKFLKDFVPVIIKLFNDNASVYLFGATKENDDRSILGTSLSVDNLDDIQLLIDEAVNYKEDGIYSQLSDMPNQIRRNLAIVLHKVFDSIFMIHYDKTGYAFLDPTDDEDLVDILSNDFFFVIPECGLARDLIAKMNDKEMHDKVVEYLKNYTVLLVPHKVILHNCKDENIKALAFDDKENDINQILGATAYFIDQMNISLPATTYTINSRKIDEIVYPPLFGETITNSKTTAISCTKRKTVLETDYMI